MTRFQRIENLAAGAFLVLLGLLIPRAGGDSYAIITGLLAFYMTFNGVRLLFYYFTMARHMPGGKTILFTGLLLANFALFSFSLVDEKRIYIVVYLAAVHSFWGLINLVKGISEIRSRAASFRIDMAQGIGNLVLAGASLCSIHSVRLLIWFFCGGLIYSGLVRIISAFRRSAVVYVQ